jgi:hypothetical protein
MVLGRARLTGCGKTLASYQGMPLGIPQVARRKDPGFSRCWQRRKVDPSEFWEGHGFSRATQSH